MLESRFSLTGGIISLLLIIPGFLLSQTPVGFASMNGGTTGGGQAQVVNIYTIEDLQTVPSLSDMPLVIKIHDTIDIPLHTMIDVSSNKTIEGVGSDAFLRWGGLWIKGNNVIIRNLSIGGSYDGDWSGTTNSTDAIRISGKNVWVDRCDLFASAHSLIQLQSEFGGGLPFPNPSPDKVADFVTISHCRFSNQNHVIVLGDQDSDTTCRGNLRTTIHNCWFDGRKDRGLSRDMPKARFGEVHVFNNYYLDTEEHCISASFESSVIVENNFFRSSDDPHIYRDLGQGTTDPSLSAAGNHYEFTTGDKETFGSSFTPGYTFLYRPVEEVPEIAINQSGIENPATNQPPTVITDTLRFSFPRPAINLVDVVLNDTDPDGDELIFAAILNEPGGNALVQDNRVYYYPVLHFGPDTVVYQIADANGGSAIGMLLINPEKDPTGGGPTDGIAEELAAELSVFPNPANLTLAMTVETELASYKIKSVELRDLTGRNLGEFDQQKSAAGIAIRWNKSPVPAGLYFLGIRMENRVMLKKIRIE